MVAASERSEPAAVLNASAVSYNPPLGSTWTMSANSVTQKPEVYVRLRRQLVDETLHLLQPHPKRGVRILTTNDSDVLRQIGGLRLVEDRVAPRDEVLQQASVTDLLPLHGL